MKKAFIYKIQNLENGKMYIGSTSRPIKRKHEHFAALRNNCHHSSYLQNSWNKYGEEMFEFTIIDECEIEIQFTREREWVIKEQTHLQEWGYNMCIPEAGGGYTHTEHHKQIKREISQKIYQQKKEQGLYKVVVIDLITNEREYYNSISDCPINFSKYYNFEAKKCYFNTNINTQEEIESMLIEVKEKYQNYLVSQTPHPNAVKKIRRHKDDKERTPRTERNAKPITIDGIVYKTKQEASEKTGLSYDKLCRKTPRKNYYVKKSSIENQNVAIFSM